MKHHYFSKWLWGTFLLLAAIFVLSSQFDGFAFDRFNLGSIVAAVLALAFLVQCLAHGAFAPLPVPLAALYYIVQDPLDLPHMQLWGLALAAVLAWIGLGILLPSRHKSACNAQFGAHAHSHHSRSGDHPPRVHPEHGDMDNNPSVEVNFGAVSRYLHSDCLETAQLTCKFGALEVFFDHAQLSPDGAEARLDCSFGATALFVPKHWNVIDKISCSLGGVDIDRRYAAPEENAPRLTLTGNVSLGGVEVRFV